MSETLGRKQRISNSEWHKAVSNIETLISKKEIDALAEKTAEEIRGMTSGKNVAYAWSGGKDSLVLEKICDLVDIKPCVLVVCNLEYKAFTDWVSKHKPRNLEVYNTGQDVEWLSKNQQMLFPQTSIVAAKWFHIVQHRGQAKFYKENKLDIMILGRRRADGNYVGKNGNIYTTCTGVTRYSPLSNWSHEQVLAFIHYNKIDIPPLYNWKNGYLCGTHPWAARQWTGSIENGWQEVFDIDKTIVTEAAAYIESAKVFLEKVNK